MEADLHNVIKKMTILKDVHKQYIMCQLFRAIRFLHSGNVLHRGHVLAMAVGAPYFLEEQIPSRGSSLVKR
ncbi:hypothetical protein COOONC_16135 [Cooperia oncophora]